ncbi:GntR family transcriptional regulator [Paralcaligenes ginsengisoli]
MSISAADRVLHEIETRIVSGQLPPGVQLDEDKLSQIFSVSRTPVREALLQLAALGFVRMVPRSGIYVVQLSANELADIFEALAHAEGLCARLVVQRIDDAQLKALRALHKEGKRAVTQKNQADYSNYNKAFHEYFYASCGNAYLISQILHARKRTGPYRMRHFDFTERMANSWFEHDRLLLAVIDRNEQAAQQLACEHILIGGKDFCDLALASPEYLQFDPDTSPAWNRGLVDMPRLFAPPSTLH